jgi:hypothetical protein
MTKKQEDKSPTKKEKNTPQKQELYSLKRVPRQVPVCKNSSLKSVITPLDAKLTGVAKSIPEESLSSSARAARFGQTGGAGSGQNRINLEDNELRGKAEGGCSC